MLPIPKAARRVIDAPRLGHIVTIDSDGTPQVSVVWIGLDDDDNVVFFAERSRQKIKNLRRDPRVAVSVEDTERNSRGLTQHLVLHGRATIADGPDVELQDRYAKKYLGVERFPFPSRGASYMVVVRIAIDRISGAGPHPGGPAGGWADPA